MNNLGFIQILILGALALQFGIKTELLTELALEVKLGLIVSLIIILVYCVLRSRRTFNDFTGWVYGLGVSIAAYIGLVLVPFVIELTVKEQVVAGGITIAMLAIIGLSSRQTLKISTNTSTLIFRTYLLGFSVIALNLSNSVHNILLVIAGVVALVALEVVLVRHAQSMIKSRRRLSRSYQQLMLHILGLVIMASYVLIIVSSY